MSTIYNGENIIMSENLQPGSGVIEMPHSDVKTVNIPTLPVKVIYLSEEIRERGLKYADPGSAAFDLRANTPEAIVVPAGETILVGTGVKLWVEHPGYAGFILPRSGLGHKHGIVLGNLTGLMDASFQGEVMVSVWNRSKEDFTIQPFDRIAQYVIMPVLHAHFIEVDFFEASERGEGGFGSSGRQ